MPIYRQSEAHLLKYITNNLDKAIVYILSIMPISSGTLTKLETRNQL